MITASGFHHHAYRRSKAHRCINTNTIMYSTKNGTVTQMQRDRAGCCITLAVVTAK